MKFQDFVYTRPDVEAILKEGQSIIADLKKSSALSAQLSLVQRFYTLWDEIESNLSIAYVRHTIDTTDAFYEAENDFIDQNSPLIYQLQADFYQALVESPLSQELERELGSQLFALAKAQIKSSSPKIIEEQQEENKLSSEYVKLIASARLEFEGAFYNLSQMQPFMESPDAAVREKANQCYWGFFEQHEEELDELYGRLVQVRTRMAQKLGYENYVQMGYDRLGRTDYTPQMVANYRRQVVEHLVPLASKLRARQARRLGREKLAYYDFPLEYKTGNATPKGDADFIVSQGERMYKEMSAQTDVFFQQMKNNALLDLVAKTGKASGGYCTYIPRYQAPFIFSNFNGTSGDVDVLTHEAGHAFQAYQSRGFALPEYRSPTLEACEIHSMSMEFFAWPWMELFFKEDTDKYKFSHLAGAVLFIPYGVCVDHFQHFVYENPTATAQERKAKWRELESIYLPEKDYTGSELLERGAFWFRQSHIFSRPFYYIDYTLAQNCALQFWVRQQQDAKDAWQDYLRLCQMGGSQPFLGLVESAHLQNPFQDGVLQKVAPVIERWLDGVDDRSF